MVVYENQYEGAEIAKVYPSFAQKFAGTPTSQMSEEETVVKTIDWESKFNEKEREWREKEKTYVMDLLKQTKELQEALTATEGRVELNRV